MQNYGLELILDLHNCNPLKFNREDLGVFLDELIILIDMEKCDRHWWDDLGLPPELCQTEPHLKGTSCIQFIKTSNITIHTLDILKSVYLNIFTCKDFEPQVAIDYCIKFFEGEVVNSKIIERI